MYQEWNSFMFQAASMLQEVNSENFEIYTLDFLIQGINQYKRLINRQSHSTAYLAFLTKAINSDPKKINNDKLTDFLPYPEIEVLDSGLKISKQCAKDILRFKKHMSLALEAALHEHWTNIELLAH
jgi:hypothetical protein